MFRAVLAVNFSPPARISQELCSPDGCPDPGNRKFAPMRHQNDVYVCHATVQ